MRVAIVLCSLLILPACGTPSNDPVGGISRDEAQALNDAAEMLDDNAVTPVVANAD